MQVDGDALTLPFGVLPVDVHCHGIGGIDFSDFANLDLLALNAAAAREAVRCIPTLYLPHRELDRFVEFMRRFAEYRDRGLLPHLPAVALEGPLLASHGGTPAATVWPPTRREWATLAGCGALGLGYLVMSPDALSRGSDLYDRVGLQHPDLAWIVRTLVAGGVRPALGHFTRTDPIASAELLSDVVDIAWSTDSTVDGARVITDHLFNDMPLNIRHAFRTRKARAERDALLASYDLASWRLADLDQQVGVVPATIIRLCHAGRVASCINFDGEHVDLAIASRAVELVGDGNIMLMTDRVDSARLGGQQLQRDPENTLWYQDGGVVAAGSQPMDRQMANARGCGIDEQRLLQLVSATPHRALGLSA